MSTDRYFQPNTPHVVYENFDDEFVLVHLVSGIYYSLSETASYLWECLKQGFPEKQILESVIESTSRLEEAAAVKDFIDELVREDLIVLREQCDNQPSISTIPNPPWDKSAYRPPRMERFTDMQDLLLLDPIHEVDASGWPRTPQN